MPLKTDPVEVTVYSREDCHLCEEAIETLEELSTSEGIPVHVTEIDIDEDADLREEYGDRIPYVLLEGRPAFKFHVDEDEGRERLRTAAGRCPDEPT